MKKNIFIISAFLLIFTGIFSACKEKEDIRKTYSSKEGRFDINETEFVRMYYSPESGFLDSPVEFIIENHTNGVLHYGTEFSLEYFDKGNWTEVKLDIQFSQMLLGLSAGEIDKRMPNYLSYGKKKGKYRYVKDFSVSYNPSVADVICFDLYTEFEIK
ncbi:MAG: hypothetical protein FWC39_00920 [Bacteroidetes bacterium]|nr:hypothetical protein [Bacteroidota bacterium]